MIVHLSQRIWRKKYKMKINKVIIFCREQQYTIFFEGYPSGSYSPESYFQKGTKNKN